MEREGDIFTLITVLSSSIPPPPSLHPMLIYSLPLEIAAAMLRGKRIEEDCVPTKGHPLSIQ